MHIGKNLLKTVISDLNDLLSLCEGRLKQTNHLRSLTNSILKGIVIPMENSSFFDLTLSIGELPSHWRKYKVPKSLSLSEWILDLKKRLKQLDSLATSQEPLNMTIWLGGLFVPEGYITASRQAAAQTNGWSLEELVLQVSALDTATLKSSTVLGRGFILKLHAASN
jgi:dynein heavy chain 1